MPLKLKTCSGCGRQRSIWKKQNGKSYCKICWNRVAYQFFKKVTSGIPASRSKKRFAEDRKYSTLRSSFLKRYPACFAELHGCTGHDPDTLTIHHKRGRIGSLYLDTRYWITLCLTCHRWVNDHPKEALLLGLAESRLNLSDEELDPPQLEAA